MVAMVWMLKKKASVNDPGRAWSIVPGRTQYSSANTTFSPRYSRMPMPRNTGQRTTRVRW